MRSTFAAALLLHLLTSCAPKGKQLIDYFPVLPLEDVAQFAIAGDEETPTGNAIPNAVFFGALPPEMMAEIEYVADTAESVVMARGRYRLDERYEALWVDMRYAWFQHQSLLIYDTKTARITGRATVAEWYGGEGGQILIGAWLLDLDGDGKKELVQRQDEYSIAIDGDEVRSSNEQLVSLWRLQDGRFAAQPVQDSLALMQRFPLPDVWDAEE
jgi:hypothetical protein